MANTVVTGARSPFPCLDEQRRYRSYPCSLCDAPRCIFGKKPAPPLPSLGPGEKHCEVCKTPYKPYGKGKYCKDACRRQAISQQRRKRRQQVGNLY